MDKSKQVTNAAASTAQHINPAEPSSTPHRNGTLLNPRPIRFQKQQRKI